MQIYSKNNKNCFFSLISWPIFILFVLSDRARWRLQNLYTKFWNSLIMLIYANLRSPGRDPGVQSAFFFLFMSYLYFSHSNFFIFSPFPGHQMFIFWPVENCTTWNLRYLRLRDAGWALRHWRSCSFLPSLLQHISIIVHQLSSADVQKMTNAYHFFVLTASHFLSISFKLRNMQKGLLQSCQLVRFCRILYVF